MPAQLVDGLGLRLKGPELYWGQPMCGGEATLPDNHAYITGLPSLLDCKITNFGRVEDMSARSNVSNNGQCWGSYGSQYYETVLATEELSKVKIDCVHLSSRLTWGTQHGNAPTLLAFRLQFDQPKGYKLEQARIVMDFCKHEEHQEDRRVVKPEKHKGSPVVMLHAPEIIVGTKHIETVHTERHISPNLSGWNITLGGVGFDKTKDYSQTKQWMFTGLKQGDEGGHHTRVSRRWEGPDDGCYEKFCEPLWMAVVLDTGSEHVPFTIKLKLEGTVRGHGLVRNLPWGKKPKIHTTEPFIPPKTPAMIDLTLPEYHPNEVMKRELANHPRFGRLVMAIESEFRVPDNQQYTRKKMSCLLQVQGMQMKA